VATSVLIIDDDDGIRASLRMALEDQGYRVDEAADGETALDRVRSTPPDVVVLDLMLRGMDGFECCRQVRRASDVPVLIVSARGDSHDIVAGFEAGADDYIRKPFDVPELLARLRTMRHRLPHPDDAADNVSTGGITGIVRLHQTNDRQHVPCSSALSIEVSDGLDVIARRRQCPPMCRVGRWRETKLDRGCRRRIPATLRCGR
jgi:DNA-binding response OmpR family regulator